MTLNEAKVYLRIDDSQEIEDALLEDLILVAESYIRDAVTDYDKKASSEAFLSKAKMCQRIILAELYKNRDQLNKDVGDFSFTVRSMITQMQYTPVPED